MDALLFRSTTDAECAAAVLSCTGDINALTGHGFMFTVLHRAILVGYPQTVAALGARGDVEPGKCSSFGYAPLHYAACRRGMVAVLLDAFPTLLHKLDVRSRNDNTALHCAAEGTAFDCSSNVQVLLELGADATLRNKSGQTAEKVACDSRVKRVFAKHAAWKASDRCAWITACSIYE